MSNKRDMIAYSDFEIVILEDKGSINDGVFSGHDGWMDGWMDKWIIVASNDLTLWEPTT